MCMCAYVYAHVCMFMTFHNWFHFLGNLFESAFRYQEFKILETQGSSEWNEESIQSIGKSSHVRSS